jgi:hypothetical protein
LIVFKSKSIYYFFSICFILLISCESAFAQYGKSAKRRPSKSRNSLPTGRCYTVDFPPTKFSEFLKSSIQAIENEFEKSIIILNDTSSLPDSIFHLAYKGDFSLSGFGLSVAELEKAKGINENSERNVKTIVQLLNLEAKKANTFSQLNLLKTIGLAGSDLSKNNYWTLLNTAQKEDWKAAGDVRIMYDPVIKTVLNGRPTNYLGVAAQIAALSFEQGFEKDEKMINKLLDHCVLQLEKNNGWLNDGKEGEFRFDRYHFEYIRFVWESAERMHRKEILKKLRPWCEQSDILWLSLMHPVSGAPFAYGRSLQNTWEDVWEYGAFMLKRKQRSKRERKEMLSQIYKTWNYYYENEYDSTRHISRMLDSGRACYSYVGPNRVWGYSVHALGKMLGSINEIRKAGFDKTDFPKKPFLKEGNNFFKLKDNYGLWVIRSQNTRLVVPIVTGIGKPKNSDYQPIPFAEGISEPPVNMPTTHLLPGIYKNGKMYLPDLKLVSVSRTDNPDSILLESTQWISKTDTLSMGNSPRLKVVYQYSKVDSKNQFSMNYSLENQDKTNPDSIVYSIWKSKWIGSPYQMGSFNPKWEIKAPDFTQKEFIHDLMKPEGRGAFTALPGRTDLVVKSSKKDLYWNIQLNFP